MTMKAVEIVHRTVILMVVFVTLVECWPIIQHNIDFPVKLRQEAATCGDNQQETLTHDESYQLVLSSLPRNCRGHWRFGIKPASKGDTAHYGFRISGTVNVVCGFGEMIITDKDQWDTGPDQEYITKKACGKKLSFQYDTDEDTVNIELIGGPNGDVNGGFSLIIEPIYRCGGLIFQSQTITSPNYPLPYNKTMSCIWELKVHQDFEATLTCPKFHLPPMRGGTCKTLLLVDYHGMDIYCGDEIDVPITFRANSDSILLFRSDNTEQNEVYGFNCNIIYKHTAQAKLELDKFL